MKRFGRSVLGGCIILCLTASGMSDIKGATLSVLAAPVNEETETRFPETPIKEETETCLSETPIKEETETCLSETPIKEEIGTCLSETPVKEETETRFPAAPSEEAADIQLPKAEQEAAAGSGSGEDGQTEEKEDGTVPVEAVQEKAAETVNRLSLTSVRNNVPAQLQVTCNTDVFTATYGEAGSGGITFVNSADTALTLDSITVGPSDWFYFNSNEIPSGTLAAGESERGNLGLRAMAAGEHRGIVTVLYTPEGGDQLTVECPVVFQVKKKPITRISGTELVTRKDYDGTVSAQVKKAGTPEVKEADVVTVEATAEYDTKDAGVNKTVTVTWNLGGADSGNYELNLTSSWQIGSAYITNRPAPNRLSFYSNDSTWSFINQASRTCTFTFPNYHIGEDPMTCAGPVWTGKEEGDEPDYYEYKLKDFYEAYKKELPQTPGIYTVRAKFPETKNWKAYTATADFEIYSEMTGGRKSLKTGIAYRFGSGSWQVTGDSTVYQGGNSFYARSEREYEFTAK